MSKNFTTLAGKLLLAMPSMTDPRFHRSVIFMCAHDEKGAMGLVINNEHHAIDFTNILEQLGITSEIEVALIPKNIQIMNGGPVEGTRGFLLHSSEFSHKDTIRIDDSFSVTGTVDALRDVAKGKGPKEKLFMLGHAGWSPGQLESELARNAWLIADPHPDIVFSALHDEKWTKSMNTIGVDPAMLSDSVGRA
jgi:putative transcriptional regulator